MDMDEWWLVEGVKQFMGRFIASRYGAAVAAAQTESLRYGGSAVATIWIRTSLPLAFRGTNHHTPP